MKKMKLFVIFFATMLFSTGLYAENGVSGDAIPEVSLDDNMEMPRTPTFISDVVESISWQSNWFLECKGGFSSFVGSPVGCGDIFDRVMPTLQVGIGKWFTPAVGGRISYQGLTFKNAEQKEMDYQYIHADFLYNLTHKFLCNGNGLSKFDVIPFVGIGMIRNSSSSPGYFTSGGEETGNHPFAFSYGIELRLRLSDGFHLVAELSGITTCKSFDCVGVSSRFGDHFINTCIGFSMNLGKKGWRRVTDAQPYISQCDYLIDRLSTLRNEKCQSKEASSKHSRNDYNGLNKLRSRLGNHGALSDSNIPDKIGIDVPVYFYFHINSTKLVDATQLSNLDEIVRIAKESDAVINITGAADKATGTKEINRNISIERTRYIAKELIERGISKERIRAVSLGGIEQFAEKEANRFCVVIISTEEK